MFERYLDTLEKSADITLKWYFQKQYLKEQLLSDAEIDRIADRVLERFTVKVDVTEAVLEIEKLKELSINSETEVNNASCDIP